MTVSTHIKGDAGEINFQCFLSGPNEVCTLHTSIINRDGKVLKSISSQCTDSVTGSFQLAKCSPWSPDDPYLYVLLLEVIKNDVVVDSYSLEVGIREIKVERDKLLINGKPVFLRGFGKHEDFPVLGKGLSYPLIVKDFELMKWIGANSFRTSHYPYAEEMIIQADRLGFLVIDEVPAVSLNFRHTTEKTLENHKISLTELIMRDHNHPSVISWSVANEPGIWGEEEALSDSADEYWQEIFNHVHDLDPTRPTMLPLHAGMGLDDPSLKYVDIIALNRYYGWYEFPGDLEKACRHLKEEMIDFYTKFKKPVMLTEFGADTIPGEHATYDNLFTEEYQAALIEAYFDVIESLPFTIGEHIWNFADFRTSQHHRRVVLNRKGVFNRNRDPKRAAFMIRNYWTTDKKV
ncbi:MAG: beta-glucuronidase [Candidatus Marinimicrobia bacterium]|nr:beta-glucuronidase [Candidatus Neomarinimicrobiota bacterium]